MFTIARDQQDPTVSRETLTQLDEYASLLLKWNAKINLIGPATEAHICKRHLEDSAQLVSMIPGGARTLVDLGSGAGLPGMVMAIRLPELLVTLVERDQRKAAFLTEVKSRLKLDNVTVVNGEISTVTQVYDIVTARALASLSELLTFAQPLLSEGGLCIFPKGVGAEEEIERAQQAWEMVVAKVPSITQEGASIVTISKLTGKHKK